MAHWTYISFGTLRPAVDSQRTDDEVRLARQAQHVEQGNSDWRAWVEAAGGSVIDFGGDHGHLRVTADHLVDVPRLRSRYEELIGVPVVLGIGTKIHEADHALEACRLSQREIMLWGPEVQEILEQNQNLQKDEPRDPRTAVAPPHFSFPARAQAPIEAQGEQPEQEQALEGLAPPPDAQPQTDFHQEFRALADQQGQADAEEQGQQQQAASQQQEAGDLKSQIVSVLKVFQDRRQELEGLQQQDPQLYQSLVTMLQAVIRMSRQVLGADSQEVQKSEYSWPVFEKALPRTKKENADNAFTHGVLNDSLYDRGAQEADDIPPDRSSVRELNSRGETNQAVRRRVLDALTANWNAGADNGRPPDSWSDVHSAVNEAQFKIPDLDNHPTNYGVVHRFDWDYIPEGTTRHLGSGAEVKGPNLLVNTQGPSGLTAVYRHTPQGFVGVHPEVRGYFDHDDPHILAHLNKWHAEHPDFDAPIQLPDDEPGVKKAALEAGATGRHDVRLPVGSQKDPSASGTRDAGKLKVRRQDGKTSWISVRANMVMAPDGNPTSSRNPGGLGGGEQQ